MSVNSPADGRPSVGAGLLGRRTRDLPAARFGAVLAAQSDRLFLWLPVCFGCGIFAYFGLLEEPPPVFGWAAAAAAVGLLAAAWRRPAGRVAALALVFVALGFVLAQARTGAVAAPRIAAPLGPATVTGTVAAVEPVARGWRVVLDAVAIEGLDAASTPARVRITLRGAPPEPGGRARVRARLMPLPGPAVPGGFDFQRQAWFMGLGAVGYAVGPMEIEAPSDIGFGAAVATLRQHVDRRIVASIGGDRGALASALVTGLRGGVSEATLVAMRESGLAHLLAISGLHLSLVAGFVFFGVRAGLALIPTLALRWPTRKLAAVAALAAAGFYLLLSGATIPTQRAFAMLVLALAAILADRLEVSMRPVALAALLVSALAPETLLGPSFQLSFAAVVALVAAYEVLRERADGHRDGGDGHVWQGGRSFWARALRYPATLALTSVVATLATAPFAAFHFNQAALYAVAANLVAVPTTGLWVMPAGLIALLAMPFGLEGPPLAVMAAGIGVVTAVAETTAAWPGAVTRGLVVPPAAMALMAVGGLWLCLWRSGLRLLGLPALAAGVWMIGGEGAPHVYLSEDGRLAAVRDADGTLLVSSLRAGRFERDAWMRHAGATAAAAWPAPGRQDASPGGAMRCDAAGCLYRRDGRTVAFVHHEAALAVDCAEADLVVVTAPVSARLVARACAGTPVLRHAHLRRDGAHMIYLDGMHPEAPVRVVTVRGRRGDRPWTGGVPVRVQ